VSSNEKVFCDEEIRELIDHGVIYSRKNNDLTKQVEPASFDTTISNIAWELPSALLFKENESIKNLDTHFPRLLPDEEGYFILEPEKHYVFLLNECVDLDLYPDVHVEANPKSSTGRADLFVRLVTDTKNKFEGLRAGYRGPLGVLVEPKTFRIGLKEGTSLNQLRFQKGNPKCSSQSLHTKYLQEPLLLDKLGNPIPKYEVKFDQGLLVSLDLKSPIYKAKKGVNEILYLDKDRNKNPDNCSDPKVFFEKISPNGELFLEKGDFILACTEEIIRFPCDTCGELESYNDKLGPDARVHYAGFVDPNWTARLTYEIRPNENLRLTHGMLMARLVYYTMEKKAEKVYNERENHYGKKIDTYTELPKFFKTWQEEKIAVQKEVIE